MVTYVSGIVRVWHGGDGWGVVDTADTPGGCWAHVSTVDVAGFRALTVGDQVDVAFEQVDQDGYAYRATSVVPAGAEPVRSEPLGPGPGFSSTLRLSFDD